MSITCYNCSGKCILFYYSWQKYQGQITQWLGNLWVKSLNWLNYFYFMNESFSRGTQFQTLRVRWLPSSTPHLRDDLASSCFLWILSFNNRNKAHRFNSKSSLLPVQTSSCWTVEQLGCHSLLFPEVLFQHLLSSPLSALAPSFWYSSKSSAPAIPTVLSPSVTSPGVSKPPCVTAAPSQGFQALRHHSLAPSS